MGLNNQEKHYQIVVMIGLIIFGTLGRYLLVGQGMQPFPNFEVIMVVTFLAMMLIRSPLALLVPLVSMIGSDLLIGNPIFIGSQMNRIVLFTYSGFTLIALVSFFNKKRLSARLGQIRFKTVGLLAGLGVGFVLLYDVWTNIGWWYLMYPHNAGSLVAVFSAGVPFMLYHMVSGAVTFIAIAVPVLILVTKKQKSMTVQPLRMPNLHMVSAVLLVVGLVVLSFTGTAMNVPQRSEVWLEKSDVTSVRVDIVGDGWTISDNVIAYSEDTAFSLLQRCSVRKGFTLEYTYYDEFDATFIDAINNLASGVDGKYWQYYVNGEMPMYSADKYTVFNGDYIVFSFEGFAI